MEGELEDLEEGAGGAFCCLARFCTGVDLAVAGGGSPLFATAMTPLKDPK